ncbi:hypothetical protein KIW84_071520 [Lathyrus oleraceus]|uniref:Uncharacterized protein n=1 Tax=Pisum sativum TaxID=3888 RepID=A0A9D4VKF4_PEA|nr:hypothetical protein KIW84_071520 [Pisum sativum]
MNSTKQTPISTQQATTTTGVVSTLIYREPYILDREPHIHLATPFEKLEVLYSDDHYIVSYVLGVKIVITKKSITSLLNMEKTGGRRIYNINPRAKYLSQEINPTIF